MIEKLILWLLSLVHQPSADTVPNSAPSLITELEKDMTINFATLEQDAATLLGKLPTIANDLGDLALIVGMIPGLQAEAAMIKTAATFATAFSAAGAGIAPILTQLQAVAAPIQAAVAAATTPPAV